MGGAHKHFTYKIPLCLYIVRVRGELSVSAC